MPLSSGRGFCSDNNASVHPAVLAAMAAVNEGHTIAYGDDPHTERAAAKMRDALGGKADVFFVFNGTGANCTGLGSVARSWDAVICAETAHINTDECGAPEHLTGVKLIPVATADGRLTVDAVRPHLHGFGVEHHSQPKVISITQLSEMGTAYRPDEIRALADLAHEHAMYLHVDGARVANAAAALDVPLTAITADAGVDILSLGGTKNGLAFGEAVVFFRPELAHDFEFGRKQNAQLASKSRYVACQFEALLADDLWLANARQANAMARRLAEAAAGLPGVTIVRPVDGNEIFATVPRAKLAAMQEASFFYVWDERGGADPEVRWVASFDSTEADVDEFVVLMRGALA
jgi:threonine aldolase